jgi:hypothetical protein
VRRTSDGSPRTRWSTRSSQASGVPRFRRQSSQHEIKWRSPDARWGHAPTLGRPVFRRQVFANAERESNNEAPLRKTLEGTVVDLFTLYKVM